MMNLVHLNEQMLAKSCSEGNKAAEEELYRRYAVKVFALCRRYLGNDDDAKDLITPGKVPYTDGSEGSRLTKRSTRSGGIAGE